MSPNGRERFHLSPDSGVQLHAGELSTKFGRSRTHGNEKKKRMGGHMALISCHGGHAVQRFFSRAAADVLLQRVEMRHHVRVTTQQLGRESGLVTFSSRG